MLCIQNWFTHCYAYFSYPIIPFHILSSYSALSRGWYYACDHTFHLVTLSNWSHTIFLSTLYCCPHSIFGHTLKCVTFWVALSQLNIKVSAYSTVLASFPLVLPIYGADKNLSFTRLDNSLGKSPSAFITKPFVFCQPTILIQKNINKVSYLSLTAWHIAVT